VNRTPKSKNPDAALTARGVAQNPSNGDSDMKDIHELREVCQSANFPRAGALLETLPLAELFRTTAAGYEPASLCRETHGLVRCAVALEGLVVL